MATRERLAVNRQAGRASALVPRKSLGPHIAPASASRVRERLAARFPTSPSVFPSPLDGGQHHACDRQLSGCLRH